MMNRQTRFLILRPLFIGLVIYFTMAIFFASVYSFFPKGFYYPTLKYEYASEATASSLNLALEKQVSEALISIYGKKFFDTKSEGNNPFVHVEFDSMKIRNIQILDDTARFQIFLTAIHDSASSFDSRTGNFNGDGHDMSDRFVDSLRVAALYNFQSSEFTFESPSQLKLLALKNDSTNRSVFSNSLSKIANQFEINSQIGNGFYTPVNDPSVNFFRMLYLSIVTLTTLGFGDIVPIHNTTRILVTLESAFGVLFVAVFFFWISRPKN